VRQEEVKSPSSGAPEISGEFIKFLKRVLVLVSKEQIDTFGVIWIGSSAHKIVSAGVLFSLYIEDQV
jgi:hypothetical protein